VRVADFAQENNVGAPFYSSVGAKPSRHVASSWQQRLGVLDAGRRRGQQYGEGCVGLVLCVHSGPSVADAQGPAAIGLARLLHCLVVGSAACALSSRGGPPLNLLLAPITVQQLLSAHRLLVLLIARM
jgi:hypothetical protein